MRSSRISQKLARLDDVLAEFIAPIGDAGSHLTFHAALPAPFDDLIGGCWRKWVLRHRDGAAF